MLKQLLQQIGTGVKNFDKIAEGVVNHVNLNNLSAEKQQIIADRTKICAECPLNSIEARFSEEYLKLTGEHYTTPRKDTHCAMCGCVIHLKVASLSSNCGLEIYNGRYPKNKQQLKWQAHK